MQGRKLAHNSNQPCKIIDLIDKLQYDEKIASPAQKLPFTGRQWAVISFSAKCYKNITKQNI